MKKDAIITGKHRERRAFTLLEIMLVLALIALLASLSWPSLEAWFQGHRLREGVDQVHTHWIKGRTLAMNEGRPYRFAWEMAGGHFRLAPDDFENWPELAGMSFGPRFSGASYPPGTLVEESLPEGIQFGTFQKNASSGGGWAEETIVFQTDGTAKIYDAEGLERPEIVLILSDRHGKVRGLSLRGMTGVVTVLTGPEVQP